MTDAPQFGQKRSSHRVKVSVPLELFADGSDTPIRGATADLSAAGCYLETMFPFAVGTKLDLKLQLENTLLIEALVVTSHPQVGNGIQFTKMLPEDREELKAFVDATAAAEDAKP